MRVDHRAVALLNVPDDAVGFTDVGHGVAERVRVRVQLLMRSRSRQRHDQSAMPPMQRRGTVFRFLGVKPRWHWLELDVSIAWPAAAIDIGGHNGDVLERDIVHDGRDRVPRFMDGDGAL